MNTKTRNPFFFKLFSWIFCPISANIANTPIEQLHSVSQDESKGQKMKENPTRNSYRDEGRGNLASILLEYDKCTQLNVFLMGCSWEP